MNEYSSSSDMVGEIKHAENIGWKGKKRAISLGAACLVLTVLGAGAWMNWGGTQANNTSPIGDANAAAVSPSKDHRLAVVNGTEITEMEIMGLMQSGVDKAIVIDRYINKVLAAELARDLYALEAEAALRAAEREVLATLYTTRRMEALRKEVTEDQIKNYYDSNVRDADFQQWKVQYYLGASPADAATVLESMKKGEKDALAQLRPLVEQGDGYAATGALPYNLGRVVSKLKRGEFSDVLPLRNGSLVLKVEDMRQLKKPTMEEVKQEIVQALAMQKFNAELEQARKKAKVELG